MKIVQVDDIGSSLKGRIAGVPYAAMVEQLGKPNVKDDPDKVDASWAVEDEETGRRLYVWNYKNGPNYTGEGCVEGIDEWSMDGDKELARELFSEAVIV